MPIHRLLYRSNMNLFGTETENQVAVAAIVNQAAARNALEDLTGALLNTRGVFIQALEGPLPTLEAAFERICCDLRHRQVELLEFIQADSRVFSEWSMVRIAPNRTIEKLFTAPCLVEEQNRGLVSATDVIKLMRTLLTTGVQALDEWPPHSVFVKPSLVSRSS